MLFWVQWRLRNSIKGLKIYGHMTRLGCALYQRSLSDNHVQCRVPQLWASELNATKTDSFLWQLWTRRHGLLPFYFVGPEITGKQMAEKWQKSWELIAAYDKPSWFFHPKRKNGVLTWKPRVTSSSLHTVTKQMFGGMVQDSKLTCTYKASLKSSDDCKATWLK